VIHDAAAGPPPRWIVLVDRWCSRLHQHGGVRPPARVRRTLPGAVPSPDAADI